MSRRLHNTKSRILTFTAFECSGTKASALENSLSLLPRGEWVQNSPDRKGNGAGRMLTECAANAGSELAERQQ